MSTTTEHWGGRPLLRKRPRDVRLFTLDLSGKIDADITAVASVASSRQEGTGVLSITSASFSGRKVQFYAGAGHAGDVHFVTARVEAGATEIAEAVVAIAVSEGPEAG